MLGLLKMNKIDKKKREKAQMASIRNEKKETTSEHIDIIKVIIGDIMKALYQQMLKIYILDKILKTNNNKN